MEDQIVNRVQNSALVTIDLEEYYTPGDRIFFDLKPLLFQELILKEKDFRAALKAIDWQTFAGKHVAIGCSADAIIPTWAYMLVAVYLKPMAGTVFFGTLAEMEIFLFKSTIDAINWHQFQGAKVVVKGCSKIYVPEAVYVEVAARLQPIVSSIMFGEPCSTVPIFKAARA